MGLLKCTSNECTGKRSSRLRIIPRQQDAVGQEGNQATTDHVLQKASWSRLTHSQQNMSVMCALCHRTQTTEQNKLRAAGQPPAVEDGIREVILEREQSKNASADTSRNGQGPASPYSTPWDGETVEDRWEVNKEGVCGVYGCSRDVSHSYVDPCGSCGRRVCFGCMALCDRIGCQKYLCMDCLLRHHRVCEGALHEEEPCEICRTVTKEIPLKDPCHCGSF